jgi:hypothetical protein
MIQYVIVLKQKRKKGMALRLLKDLPLPPLTSQKVLGYRHITRQTRNIYIPLNGKLSWETVTGKYGRFLRITLSPMAGYLF